MTHDMNDHGGWIGSLGEVRAVLRAVDCDRNPDGSLHVEGVCVYMGDTSDSADAVVRSEAWYEAGGVRHSLVNALRQTSYGMAVTVI